MIVPGKPSTTAADGPTQDNAPGPGQAALLMAAAEMQRLGRFRAQAQMAHESDMNFISRTGNLANPEAFEKLIQESPMSQRIEDRRGEDPKGPKATQRKVQGALEDWGFAPTPTGRR